MSDVPNLSYTDARGTRYYRYRFINGKYRSLGTDLAKAQQAARALNVARAALLPKLTVTMADVIDAFTPIKLRASKSTRSQEGWLLRFNQYKKWCGAWPVAVVTVRMLDDLLAQHAVGYEPYRIHRLLLGELFTFAIGKGWREQAAGNPAKVLLPPKMARAQVSKQRLRLTVEQYAAIHNAAPEWLQLAMDLSRLIGIRRTDLCALRFSDFHDGALHFIPSKTADVPNPAAIRIAMGPELTGLFDRAAALSPRSEYFIHKHNSFARGGESRLRTDKTQVLPEQLTRCFARVRESVRAEVFSGYADAELPGFHEVRSLCSREWRAKGWDVKQVQLLLGHSSEEMTLHYQGGAGINWQDITL
jgi:enterobacteria phage integrase